MPPEESLSIPLDIPWKLASSTQRLKEGDAPPDETTISLFYYEPDIESLGEDYPDEQLVYVKLAVSISPVTLISLKKPSAPQSMQGQLKKLMRGGLPVWHVLLDLKVTPDPFVAGGVRPYLHAVAPQRREMIETGVVGAGLYEGESEGVSVGKSASSLHETVSSKVKTQSSGSSIGFGAGGAGVSFGHTKSSSTTTVDSDRQVDQTIESTLRDASQERRELLSHTTDVHNVLTLLHAKHVGSPYVRFSLWPRPLHLLSLDPSDPNLWYHQLLRHRSSGIEGLQEFVGVLVVPRGEKFCLEARLRRFAVLDVLPAAPRLVFAEGMFDLQDRIDVVEYLYAVYPRGTPLENLDVDVLSQIEASTFPRPVVNWWGLHPFAWSVSPLQFPNGAITLGFASPMIFQSAITTGMGEAWYKEFTEVYLEMQTAKHEAALARSPLERGIVLAQDTILKSCFATAGGTAPAGPLTLTEGPDEVAEFRPDLSAVPPERETGAFGPSHIRHRRNAMRWNHVQAEFARHASGPDLPSRPFRPDDPAMVRMLLESWAELAVDDPLNLPLEEAVTMLGLGPEQQRAVREAGATDLRGVARMVLAAPRLDRENREMELLRRGLSEAQLCAMKWEPTPLPLPLEGAAEVRERIAAELGRLEGAEEREEGRPGEPRDEPR